MNQAITFSKVKAHSGSKIFLHEDELEKMQTAEDNINKFYHQEMNLSSPDIRTQIDFARKKYERAVVAFLFSRFESEV